MDWSRSQLPPMRYEARFGDRIVPAFADRPESLWAMIADARARNADGEALIAGHVRLSWQQAVDQAARIAAGFRRLGLQRGDRVAILLGNRIEFPLLLFAAAHEGLVTVLLGTRQQKLEIAYVLADCGAKILIHEAALAERLPDAQDVPDVIHRVAVDDDPALSRFTLLADNPPAEAPAETSEDDTAMILYTSGTTGKPKGVRRPLAKAPPEPVSSGYAMFMMVYGMKPGQGVHLVVSPLYHTAVLYFASSTLHLGHQVVIMDKWTPEEMLSRIQRYGVTNSHMVPTQFSRLLACEERERWDMSSLQNMVHGAAPCPQPVKRAMLDWWGDCVYEYYAASEGGGTIIGPADWRGRPGSVGKPWPTADIKIFDDEGYELGADEVGTVYIKMAQGFEYHKDRAKTEKAWRTDGYFTVGDAGYLDSEGYLFLCDRKADMIISGGVNIYPAEIESVMAEHPRVLDVAVFGIPDDDWGEQVKAVIELVGDADPNMEQELLAWGRERLARFKCPKSIDFVERMPREENGKLRKRLLRDPYWEGTGRNI